MKPKTKPEVVIDSFPCLPHFVSLTKSRVAVLKGMSKKILCHAVYDWYQVSFHIFVRLG